MPVADANAAELVTNGGFETGNFSGWTATNPTSPWRLWTVSGSGQGGGPADGFTPVPVVTSVQQGTFNAWNGVAAGTGQSFTLTQDVALPAGFNIKMSWMDRYQMNFTQFCTSGCGTSTYAVEVLNTSNVLLQTLYTVTTVTNTNTNTGWVNHVVNLTAFRGQTVRLRFRTTVSLSLQGPGQIEIDAVSVQPLQPTAAKVSVSGMVQNAVGRKIRGASVFMTDSDGAQHLAVTNAFGYYTFNEIPLGSALLSVAVKRYTFATPTRVININDTLADLNFVSLE